VTATSDLAAFASRIAYKNVPREVTHVVKNAFIDCLGCAIAGTETRLARIAADWVKRNAGREESTLIADNWKGPSANIVFANTISTNALDFEPFGPESHITAVAVPSALAVSEVVNASGKEFLAALAAGIEVAGRVGVALKRFDRTLYKNWPILGHTHAVFAAVAVTGRLLRLDTEQMIDAFGIAGYSATLPTLKRMFSHFPTPMTKYDNLGLIAQAGVQAAFLAQNGFTGDKSVLDGDDGFWKISGYPECNWAVLVPPEDESWFAKELWFKPYPVTSYTVTALEGVLGLMRENRINQQDIEEIIVSTKSPQFPGVTNRKIESSLDAWLSWPYNIAALASDVRPLKNWQSDHVYQNNAVLEFMKRVKVEPLSQEFAGEERPSWEGWSPARVVIKTKNSRQYEKIIHYLRKVSDQELEGKFLENVDDTIGREAGNDLLETCKTIEEFGNIADLPSKCLRAKRPI
jgi:2-methylcitrate dehydratase PrpD